MKRALITGITGQDGAYLAELLLSKGYEVYGLVRRLSTPNHTRIGHLIDKVTLLDGDMLDQASLTHAMNASDATEVYNLAAQSFVQTSFKQPVLTSMVSGVGVVNILEAVKHHNPSAKFYQASTSELFGKVRETPQNETTPFHPRSPYGFAKMLGYWATVNYRESYNMFAVNGILFNHESPRRGLEFVTRKITYGVARIHHGLSKEIRMGNLDAKRDWGFAGDYVKAMWLMLQHKNPEDFVIATGETHTVKEFVEKAFEAAGITNWEKYVVIDPKHFRPAEVNELIGNPAKAKKELNWEPEVSFEKLVKMMVDADIQLVEKEQKWNITQ